MNLEQTTTADSAGQLDSVILDYLKAVEAGFATDRQSIMARQPHVADQLAVFFADQDWIAQMIPTVPPMREAAQPGSAVKQIGDYVILNEISHGGMGIVYRARQNSVNRVVALKMILTSRYASLEERVRFQMESEAVARLNHPNIVQLFEVGEHEGQPYFCLEFCEGGDLDKQLDERRARHDPLTARAAAALVEKLARALHYAHSRGVVHRDLKPGNVLLTPAGEPKITDFGLAKHMDSDAKMTRTGVAMGSPPFMAPEQAAGRIEEIGPLTDVYALGATLYKLLTDVPPFLGNTAHETMQKVMTQEPVPPSHLNTRTPRDLETICLKCLAKEPTRRYDTAEEFADDLRRFLSGEPIRARPVGWPERAAKWVKRRRAIASLAAGLVLVTTLGSGGILWKYFDSETQRGRAEGLAEKFGKEKDVANELRHRAEGLAEDFRLQKVIAEEKTTEALKAERNAKRELDRSEGMVYAGNLLQAQLFWDAGNVAAARDRLDACRWDYRGWEHACLRRQFQETCATLKGHTGVVCCVCFSADGKRLASGGGDVFRPGEVKLWDAATGQELRSLTGHTSTVYSVSFSADGKRLASGGGKLFKPGEVKLWDAATGKELCTLTGHTGIVTSVSFSPDGKLLASGGADFGKPGEVKVWDVATGKELFNLPGHIDDVTSVSFSPDGKRLVSGGGHFKMPKLVTIWELGFDTAAVKVWDVATGKELFTLKARSFDVTSVCFSPDGTRLAIAREDKTVELCDAAKGKKLFTLKGHNDRIANVNFSPDGKRLATASWDGTVKLWDAETAQEYLTLKGHTSYVWGVSFSPDGKRVSSASWDKTVKIWEATTGQELRTFKEQTSYVRGVSFSPDGKCLASWDETVKVWDAATGQELRTLTGHIKDVTCVCFSPDGKRLASGSADNTAKVWNAATGRELRTLKGHSNRLTSVIFSPDGNYLVTASWDRTVKIWDASTGQELRTLTGHTDFVTSVSFSPDGKRLASASSDKSLKLWDTVTGHELLTLTGHTESLRCVSFSPDGKRLASASWDNTIKVWDAVTGQESFTLKGHIDAISSVSFSPNSKRLASASKDKTVRLWDAATGQELLTLKALPVCFESVSFSPDGKRLACGCDDRTVKVWELATGQELLVLKGDISIISSVCFTPEGKRVIARSDKGEVRSWNAVTGQEIVPCTDPPPAAETKEAVSPDSSLRATADGATVRVVRTDDKRLSSDLVFLSQLNDIPARLRWHRTEAADSETNEKWFAAAFHLRQLLAAKEADANKLQERLKRCEDNLRQP